MKADLSNLGKWIDELTTNIDNLDRRVNEITASHSTGELVEIVDAEIVSGNISIQDKKWADYDLFLITVYEKQQPEPYTAIGRVWLSEIVAREIMQSVGSPMKTYRLIGAKECNATVIFGGYSEIPNTFRIAVDPLPQVDPDDYPIGTLTVNIKGIKLGVEAQRTSLIKRAADAVKNIMKGGH